jgi:hypothetical protein
MTTQKTYHAQASSVTFGRPTVGPRVYLTTGPSGWPETFSRATADRTLKEFLDPVELDEALSTFHDAMALEGREETWEDVADHLSRVTHQPRASIPRVVVVAFWGLYTIHLDQEGAN